MIPYLNVSEVSEVYEQWLKERANQSSTIFDLVNSTQATCDLVSDRGRESIERRFSALEFTPRIWSAFFANTVALTGVTRKDGKPYAAHPARMALTCLRFSRLEHRESAAVSAILHDYLEETGGVSRESYLKLSRLLPGEKLGALSAVFLTEPIIGLSEFEKTIDSSRLKRISYLIQAIGTVQKYRIAAFADAALADKLDNLHDLFYLEKVRDLEIRKQKLAQRVGFFVLVLEGMRDVASPELVELVKHAIDLKISHYAIENEVENERLLLSSFIKLHEARLQNLILRYQKNIGVEYQGI